jgi:hypothetical protein
VVVETGATDRERRQHGEQHGEPDHDLGQPAGHRAPDGAHQDRQLVDRPGPADAGASGHSAPS